VTELKEQAKDRAVEKADELKLRAKEAVMRKSVDIKERADTPRGWSMLGAILGAGVGSVLMKKAFDVRRRSEWATSFEGRRMYGEYDRENPSLVPAPDGGLMRPTGDARGTLGSDIGVRTSTDVGVMDTAKDKAQELKERASHLVDQARDKASGLREHIPDRYAMRARATDWYDTVSDNPVLLAIGGIAIGALFASFLPVTNRERELIEPAKAKVKERISELGDQLEGKLSGQSEEEFQSSAASESERERGSIPPLPPLDDYTSVH
jgi:ElaB/YqjD/DUF883 family membrane-anchored ribosome-binding protein